MKILVEREFLEKLKKTLETMIYYADDGVISRGDENYKDFFNDLDMANDISNDLCNLLEKEK